MGYARPDLRREAGRGKWEAGCGTREVGSGMRDAGARGSTRNPYRWTWFLLEIEADRVWGLVGGGGRVVVGFVVGLV